MVTKANEATFNRYSKRPISALRTLFFRNAVKDFEAERREPSGIVRS
jgi:hypothetical protein